MGPGRPPFYAKADVLKGLAKALRQKNEIKGNRLGREEIKLSLYEDDMLFYIENPKGAILKLLELIND